MLSLFFASKSQILIWTSVIKDKLCELLGETPYPLPYWHIEEKVLEVCNCKPASVRMTLQLNPKVFKKFDGDQFGLARHFSPEAAD